MTKLDDLKILAKQYKVVFISDIVLSRNEFIEWSGSAAKEHHHYGDGGLLKHTWEVTNIALESNKVLGFPADERLLYLACIFHDIGKIYDYQKVNGVWGKTRHKEMVGHLSRSAIIWMETVNKYDFDKENSESVLHGILAHHGMREWGSPVTPKTPLAWILHCADSMSARVDESKNDKI